MEDCKLLFKNYSDAYEFTRLMQEKKYADAVDISVCVIEGRTCYVRKFYPNGESKDEQDENLQHIQKEYAKFLEDRIKEEEEFEKANPNAHIEIPEAVEETKEETKEDNENVYVVVHYTTSMYCRAHHDLHSIIGVYDTEQQAKDVIFKLSPFRCHALEKNKTYELST